MNLPTPYRECGCHDPETGKRLGRACPKLGTVRGHGAWYVRYEAPAGGRPPPAGARPVPDRGGTPRTSRAGWPAPPAQAWTATITADAAP